MGLACPSERATSPSLSRQPLIAALPTPFSVDSRGTIWLPGVVGAEAEVAQEAGVGGWPQGPECLLLFFLFCTKANCTCFIFLREDCRQLEIAAFCLHILKNLARGWRGLLPPSVGMGDLGRLSSTPAIWRPSSPVHCEVSTRPDLTSVTVTQNLSLNLGVFNGPPQCPPTPDIFFLPI